MLLGTRTESPLPISTFGRSNCCLYCCLARGAPALLPPSQRLPLSEPPSPSLQHAPRTAHPQRRRPKVSTGSGGGGGAVSLAPPRRRRLLRSRSPVSCSRPGRRGGAANFVGEGGSSGVGGGSFDGRECSEGALLRLRRPGPCAVHPAEHHRAAVHR